MFCTVGKETHGTFFYTVEAINAISNSRYMFRVVQTCDVCGGGMVVATIIEESYNLWRLEDMREIMLLTYGS